MTLGPEERREQMSTWADGLPGARRMAREREREKQREGEREEERRRVSAEGLVRGGSFKFGSNMGDFTPADRSTTLLSTKQAFTIDPKLGTLLAGPTPTPAEIESLIHDPTFPLTSNPIFATLSPEERRGQMTSWADELPGARRMARVMEGEKQKERERVEDKGDKNVEGLVRGRRFNFGYDMGEFTLASESEIPEDHSATDSNCDESPTPTTNRTKDTIMSSKNNSYNIPPYQRRYRLQGRPSSYNNDALSDEKQQAMTKLWLEQNPTLVFRLPSPEAGEDDDGNERAKNPIQVRHVTPPKESNAHATAANPTRVWRVPSLSNDDDDDAHAPPAAAPARVWRVPSPSDEDDDDNGNDDTEASPPTASTAAKGRRHAPRKVPRVRMGRYIVTSPDDADWVIEDAIISRAGVERKGKQGGKAKKASPEGRGGSV